MFTLRNLSFTPRTNPTMLNQAFFDEVGCDILCQTLNFAIGYYKKSTKLWLNNEEDVHDAHDVLLQYGKLTFWCTGKKSKQRYYGSSDGSDKDGEDTRTSRRKRQLASKVNAREERKTRVNDLKTQLREKHGPQFSGVQYALWAETIVAGTHESLEEPPPVPMFGAQRPRGHSRGSDNLTDALTVMADKLATALTQPSNPSSSGTLSPHSSSGNVNYCSPSKSAELRGKYIHQLKELVNLRGIGALTGEEFQEQRSTIVNLLKKL